MAGSNPRRQKTTWNDLHNVGFGKSKVRQQYKETFGTHPDGVHVNEGICVKYGHYCYNYLGDVHTYAKGVSVVSDVTASRDLENDTDTEVTQEVTLSTDFAQSLTMIVTKSSEISFTGSITLGGEKFGLKTALSETFTIKNEVHSECKHSRSTTVSDTVTVTVPPHAKVRVELAVTWTKMTEDFEIPITISGYTGANFPHRVGHGHGHYYWFCPVPPNLKSKVTGVVESAYDASGKLTVKDV